jgi:feruloyl esterase
MCSYDATALQCTGAQGEVPCTDPSGSSCTCLLPDQALAMNYAWRGVLDDQGRVLYPGYERSFEDPSLANGLVSQEALSEPAFDSLMYWAFGSDFNWASLFSTITQPVGMLSSGIAAVDQTKVADGMDFIDVMNASNANWSQLNAHGGKLIMYSGYSDPSVPSPTVLDYYNQALKDDPNTPSFVSVYMAPGMGHCHGGPGANVFGNITNFPPKPGAPSDDIQAAIVRWVEKGVKPHAIIATKYVNDDPTQGIAAQRPLCAYPGYAKYDGGDPTKYTSFSCSAGALVTNQAFDPLYGPY